MDMNADKLRKEAVTQGARMDVAKLASLEGRGTLQVWRGQRQDILEIRGTWRTDSAVDPAEIKRAVGNSDPLVYEGPVDDPAQTGLQDVRTEVKVSSVSSYLLDNGSETPEVFVNFVPADPTQVAS